MKRIFIFCFVLFSLYYINNGFCTENYSVQDEVKENFNRKLFQKNYSNKASLNGVKGYITKGFPGQEKEAMYALYSCLQQECIKHPEREYELKTLYNFYQTTLSEYLK